MVTNDLQGQTALILGGSSGLGLAAAQKLASHGMRLVVLYRASRIMQADIDEQFNNFTNPGQHLTINADATNSAKIPEIVAQIISFLNGDKLSMLLHSISKGNLRPVTGSNALTIQDFEQTTQSMAFSFYSWFKALHTMQALDKQARILAFTSEGSTKPVPGYAAVSVAKAALEAIARSIALEYGSSGITANCIQAGVTDTPSLRRIPGVETLLERSLERNPTNRLTTPQDVANVVYLLCRPESQFINGIIIKVDGGESLT
jgi:enoyl-[acyl-carrier protein] reductase I